MAEKRTLAGGDPSGYQSAESTQGPPATRLNALRAAVLGANDGIVSTAGILTGVAGATLQFGALVTAGVAGVTAGALSMAVGEYVSVGTQRDSEAALLHQERRELAEMPEEELAELTALYVAKGLTPDLARRVADQLHAHDALAAHAETELGIDPHNLTSPVVAAVSSALAFVAGSLLPLAAMLLSPDPARLGVTVVSVVLALATTGVLSARWGGTPVVRSIARNVLGGLLAMGVTYWIGRLVGLGLG
nr:VIT family protein [Propionibacterium sp.]